MVRGRSDMPPRTGSQFLEGLRARKRELYLENELVDDVTSHPSLAGAARTMAGVFDVQHRYPDDCLVPDSDSGDLMNVSHMIPRSKADLLQRRRGLERIHAYTLGHMGRSPDYCNISLAGFAALSETWAGSDGRNARGAGNLIDYQKRLRREDLSLTHTLIQPSINKATDNRAFAGSEVLLHKVGETTNSIVVRGARILATLAPYA